MNSLSIKKFVFQGLSWKKGHDIMIVVKVLAFEIRPLGMSTVDSDFIMRNDYGYPTSQNWGSHLIPDTDRG